ncbi:HEAT repeat domain-containing protein [Lentzea nigeriaca]|uniref:HEAT repeat domain-containing protein n=1 Tax=Lentzea nigeriaca TaxID=1128665 RepID=UPI001EF7CC9D|nr:HEAT repeat domain-containing protein [Lentzea nigeriaca]
MTSAVVLVATVSSLVLGLLITVHHTVSARLRQRREQEAQRLRPLVFRLLGDPGVLPELVALDGRTWAAVEPTVLTLLGNVSGAAREQLVELLARRGVLDSARVGLRARRAHVRVKAVQVVGLLRSREDLPQVVSLMGDSRPEVRIAAARTLGGLADVRAARPLLGGLTCSRPVPSHVVAHSLLTLGISAHPVLVDALRHPHATVRAVAAEVLGRGGAVVAFSSLVRLLREDTELPVRLAAVRALARTGTPSTAAALVEFVGRGSPAELRIEAAEALGELGDPAAGETLGFLLAEKPHRLAHNASRSLLRLGDHGRGILTSVAGGSIGPAAAAHAVEALAWDRISQARLAATARSRS